MLPGWQHKLLGEQHKLPVEQHKLLGWQHKIPNGERTFPAAGQEKTQASPLKTGLQQVGQFVEAHAVASLYQDGEALYRFGFQAGLYGLHIREEADL